jgi:hypothetical protein
MTSPPPGDRDAARNNAAVRQLYVGGANNRGTFTLRASQTTTVIAHEGVNPNSHISWTPLTASAVTALAAGMRVSNRTTGSFTITHASNAAVDQNFTFSTTGGSQ